MLKASCFVPLGTPESVKAGGLEPQLSMPAHEKLRDMAPAEDAIISADNIAAVAAATKMNFRIGFPPPLALKLRKSLGRDL
jgi:hypothetical protein